MERLLKNVRIRFMDKEVGTSLPSLTRVVRGGLWLYPRSLVNNLSGFIYWMVNGFAGGSVAVSDHLLASKP